ncbi:MAG: CDP-diacylglycerol--glycerol-3-phosphate 3-phosphatidyltransferase [Malacoplasma sp.]|nr:CDP-diacylglycerol--glycerol-3-phosphate 3-phosphatidyltransferase [Malacoplasma sp.]
MEAKQTELKSNSKWSKIPNALTISRLVFAVAIVIVLFIKPYNWIIDNGDALLDEGFGTGSGFYNFPMSVMGTYHGIEVTYSSFMYIQFYVAAGLFILGCLTDFLDGYLSRKYNWISNFGKIMDPVADKVLVDSVLIVLAVFGLTYVWIVIIIIARDILVDATRMVKAKEGIVVPANIWGKCKTVFQMIGILMFLIVFNRIGIWNEESGIIGFVSFKGMYNPATAIANSGLCLALIFSVVSGVIYEVKMLAKPKVK